MDIAYSKNGVPIRLGYERWYHIIENHDELASYYHDILDIIEKPDFIMRGNKGTLKATRNLGKGIWRRLSIKRSQKKTGL